ncbi:MAG: hypothetical protein KDH95_21740 [Calditrichaeota bacterium]|nr:hypothetical protein [Calditrichota bacterium]MCB0270796.1 hypothetical protein [Calditrichota bacterium]
MAKKIVALILGIVSFFLMFAVGEPFGIYIAFIVIGIYYLLSQFFLSLGNPRALYEDWQLILILNAALIATAILILFIEPDTKWHSIIAIISIVCSAIGARIAAWLAKKP